MTRTNTGTEALLTDRQREVVALIAAGCSNDEVGISLGISARTAKAHSDALRVKLGVARRRQIPAAFRQLTGEDPSCPRPRQAPAFAEPLTAGVRGPPQPAADATFPWLGASTRFR